MQPDQIIALTVPTALNLLLYGLFYRATTKRLDDFKAHMDVRFDLQQRVIDARFDAARADLLRVEGVMDARLKHLEERVK